MENSPLAAFKSVSIYVGLAVVVIFALAAFGLFRFFQAKTAVVPSTDVSSSPQASPAGFDSEISPTPATVLGTTPDQQPTTGPSLAYYVVILGLVSTGFYLARFKRST